MKNKTETLEIESLGYKGISVARKDGLVYFVKGGVPGDKVSAQIKRKKKSYFEATIEEVLEPSSDRVEPECKYFGICGGCSWQQIAYEKQLYWKRRQVEDAFERIGKLEVGELENALASPEIFRYRNKMEFSFAASRWLTKAEIDSEEEIEDKRFALGLHVPKRFDKVLDIDECKIQPELGDRILNLVRDKARELDIAPYHQVTHEGFLRNLIIRSSSSYEEMMAILVTAEPKDDDERAFVDWFGESVIENYEEVKSVVWAVNDEVTPVAYGKYKVLNGLGYIIEKILTVDFKISPFSFFQTNSFQLNKFIDNIIEKSRLQKNELVWDLYCGTGSITLPAAKYCNKILGVELSEESVLDARQNAELNCIDNVDFISADLHKKDSVRLLKQLPKPDLIIMDPPRAGVHKNLLSHILKIEPKRIVYVSCNPTTQARDCAILSDSYEIKSVTPADMFPHTYHIESIAELVRI